MLDRPLVVKQPGATVSGELRLKAHNRQSYDVHLTLRAPALQPGGEEQESSGQFDLKEPFYRQLTQFFPAPEHPAAAVQGAALVG